MARPKKAKKDQTAEIAIEKPTETKEQVRKRLAESRVPRACRYILLIGNLATYKPSDAEIDQIMEALGTACAAVENRMRGTKKSVEPFVLRTIGG